MKHAFVLSFLLAGGVLLSAAEKLLPELAKPEAWTSDAAVLPISAREGFLAAELNFTKNTKPLPRLLLKTPLSLKAGEYLTFEAGMDIINPMRLHVIFRDAKGNTFRAIPSSAGMIQDGNLLGGIFRGGLDEIGMADVSVPALRDGSRTKWISKTNSKPVLPFTVLGLELNRERSQIDPGNHLYLGNFRVTDAVPEKDPFFWSFGGRAGCGGREGLPKVRLSDFQRLWGNTHIADWELRTEYAGQPVKAGSWKLVFRPDDKRPWKLRFAEGFRIPFREKGTCWVRVKLRSCYDRHGVPACIRELDFRYDVFNGDAPAKHARLSPDARIGESMIRIAYDHDSFLWKNGEKKLIRTRFFDASGMDAAIKVTSAAGKQMFSKQVRLTRSPEAVEADLSSLPAGAWNFTVQVRKNGKIVDSLTRSIGFEGSPTGNPFVKPDLPSAREIIANKGKPLTVYCPMIHEKNKYVQYHIQLMDEMVKADAGRDLEIQVSWRECEPLPGIYDFSVLDAVLDAAKERKIRCLVTMAPLIPPEWMPSYYTQSADGRVFGHNMYLFHGGRINLFQADPVRESALRYLKNMTLHLRNHPALLGYFYISEHSGEAPWAGWYEGFDPFTLKHFRDAMQKQYRSIGNANKAWKTAFASFDAVRPPAFHEKSSLSFRRDWLLFRRLTTHRFILECVKTVRQLDPCRLIQVYGDGIIYTRLPELAAYQVITANGGCATPERTFNMSAVAEAGVPQRAEEISCSQWSPYPYMLDISLFTMLGGGGSNTHFKMFVRQNSTFESIRKAPQDWDRYRRFIPIREELRGSERVYDDIRAWAGFEGVLTAGKTVNQSGLSFGLWGELSILHSQLSAGTNALPVWKKAKLVMVSPQMKCLSAAEAKDLVGYVRNGGTLFLPADTGRTIIEREGEDWALLHDFGFASPKQAHPDWRFVMVPEKGSRWEKRLPAGAAMTETVNGFYQAPEQAGEVLMRRKDRDQGPALTVKPFGKGKVYVLWGREYCPKGFSDTKDLPFLREIARDSGCPLHTEADTRKCMMILLRKGETHYLAVLNPRPPSWMGADKKAVTMCCRLPLLPKGTYRISELVNGKKDFPEMSAEAWKKKGLSLTLQPGEVAILKLEKIK